MLKGSKELIKNLQDNTKLFRTSMKKAGFNILGHDDCPIAPVYLGDAKLASGMSEAMMDRFNIYVIGFSFPVVPKGQARIRCQLSSAHTKEQIEKTVHAFTEVGKEKGVI